MICDSCGNQMEEEYVSGDAWGYPSYYLCKCGKAITNPDIIYVKMTGSRRIRIFTNECMTVSQLKDAIADKMHLRANNWGIYERSKIKNRLVRITDEDQLLSRVDKYNLRFFPNAVIR